MSTNRRMIAIMIYHIMHNKKNEKFYSIETECSLRYIADKEIKRRGRSQDGRGIGQVITFSSTNSLKEQQNGEQSLQKNF